MLSKLSAYTKSYDGQTKWMNFLIKDDELYKKHNDIWNKLVIVSKKNLTWSPSKIKKSYKTEIKCYGDDTAGFHARKLPEVGCNYICWSLILIDAILKKSENYYLQVSLREYKDNDKRGLDTLLMT